MLASLGLVIPAVAISNPSSALKIEKCEWLLLWCVPEMCWARSLVDWAEKSMLMLTGLRACLAKSTDLWKETDEIVKGVCGLWPCHSFLPCRLEILAVLEVTSGSALLSDVCLSLSCCFFQSLLIAGRARSDGSAEKGVICFSKLVMSLSCAGSISLLISP